jgi:hypothetical protein
MEHVMSIAAKKELLASLKNKYIKAELREEKIKIIDALIFATGYKRKYAITLLNKEANNNKIKNKGQQIKYDQTVKLALITIWNAANRICSKRLKPFLPIFIESLEKHGHLFLTEKTKDQLSHISTGTIDLLLKDERVKLKGKSTTRSGSMLKKQIKIRTFSDWDDIIPGFFEADLVAHCGGSTSGSFLNTLTLTDISSGWTECLPLLYKSKENVIEGLKVSIKILLFKILGIDTDNGSEFINYALLEFCETHNITFTRSRAYKKNDQAHVEEKNGSIVRKIVGYDRFEGIDAWKALAELYASLRLYVNFFQPSLKLLSKKRDGAKVTKQYDKAKTPCQRLLEDSNIPNEVKQKLQYQSETLDPVILLQEIQQKQQNLWKYAWKEKNKNILVSPKDIEPAIHEIASIVSLDKYKSTKKSTGNKIRLYKTRKNPFEEVENEVILRLELNPEITANEILQSLIKMDSSKYKMNQIRTLQRQVANWRQQQWHKINLEVCKRGEEGILQNNFSSLVLTGNSLNNTSNLTV